MIDHNDLLEAGWPRSAVYADLIAAARAYEAKGIKDKAYILKLLERDFEKPDARLQMRRQPVEWSEAIKATCPEDEENIGSVRRYMRQLMKVPVVQAGAIMPDSCPAGAGEATIPVGGAIAVKNAIIPSAHSADICCSMYASIFESDQPVDEMLDALMASTRFGPGGRSLEDLVPDPVVEEDVWENRFLSGLQNYAAIHIADQGDGNHFAFLGKLEIGPVFIEQLKEAGHHAVAGPLEQHGGKEYLVLVTHHGSRGLGAHVYKRGQKAAVRETERLAENIPGAAAWLDYESEIGKEYWAALQYVGRWTKANHRAIHRLFLGNTGAGKVAEFGNEHNFVWKRGDLFYHGKGATPAWKDDEDRPLLGLIPLNMAAPILVTLGKDNEEYLSFAPHGAGRNLSRTALKRNLLGRDSFHDIEKIQNIVDQNTRGLDIRWFHGKADLSESPVAYKPAEQVKEQIEAFGLADVIAEISPLGCIMAGDSGPKPWQREKEMTPKQKRQIEHRANRRKTRQKISDWDDDDDR
ncbi:MAG: RtcB family protein [Verrucomicrobiales bacterium]|nr:RtcB family protein [Verrucomicrobiales bacterium]